MKYLILLAILVTNVAWAETASDRALEYFSDINNRNFSAAAGHFDPAQLKEFRTTMEFYKGLPPEAQTQFVQTFFGPSQTVESISAVSDVEFFSGIFNFIMQQADQVGGMNFEGVEILGEVKEGDNIAHLVTRNRVSVGEIDVEAMEVVSLKKNGDDWSMLMSGSIKGLPAQLNAAFSQGQQ
ncbi:Uncharacterised protein [Halioglobus japonicus]|nr:Uncharacterised protein [Halioglobus japonicus]